MKKEWNEFKQMHLLKLNEALNKDEVDKPIIKLLNQINSLDDYVTTSSCSGRVLIVAEGKKRKMSEKLRTWHFLPTYKEFKEECNYWKNYKDNRIIWFKLEGFILHTIARTFEDAKYFFKLMKQLGIKRGGIQPIRNDKFLIEIMGTTHVSIPIKNVCSFQELYNLSKERLKKNWKMIDKITNKLSELE